MCRGVCSYAGMSVGVFVRARGRTFAVCVLELLTSKYIYVRVRFVSVRDYVFFRLGAPLYVQSIHHKLKNNDNNMGGAVAHLYSIGPSRR